jgi:hypothetical protein
VTNLQAPGQPKDQSKSDRKASSQTKCCPVNDTSLNELRNPVHQSCTLELVLTLPLRAPHPEGSPVMDLVTVVGVAGLGLAREGVWVAAASGLLIQVPDLLVGLVHLGQLLKDC